MRGAKNEDLAKLCGWEQLIVSKCRFSHKKLFSYDVQLSVKVIINFYNCKKYQKKMLGRLESG